jgi:hypothetical protein
MPSSRSSHSRSKKSSSSRSGERISSSVSRRSRRLATLILGLWFGGILLVSVAPHVSFRAVEQVMAERQPVVAHAVEKVGPVATRDLLRFQVAEANRLTFSVWGWFQLFLSAMLLLLLVFLSNARRISLICAAAMTALATLSCFVLIPRIVESGPSSSMPGTGAERFELMNSGFTTFQGTILLLGLVLLFSLFGGSDRGGRSSNGDSGEL